MTTIPQPKYLDTASGTCRQRACYGSLCGEGEVGKCADVLSHTRWGPYFRMVEVKVSSPRYVSFLFPHVAAVWIQQFCCVQKQAAIRCTTSLSARSRPREHVVTISGVVILRLGKLKDGMEWCAFVHPSIPLPTR